MIRSGRIISKQDGIVNSSGKSIQRVLSQNDEHILQMIQSSQQLEGENLEIERSKRNHPLKWKNEKQEPRSILGVDEKLMEEARIERKKKAMKLRDYSENIRKKLHQSNKNLKASKGRTTNYSKY